MWAEVSAVVPWSHCVVHPHPMGVDRIGFMNLQLPGPGLWLGLPTLPRPVPPSLPTPAFAAGFQFKSLLPAASEAVQLDCIPLSWATHSLAMEEPPLFKSTLMTAWVPRSNVRASLCPACSLL